MEPCDNCGDETEQYREITGPEIKLEIPLCEECQ